MQYVESALKRIVKAKALCSCYAMSSHAQNIPMYDRSVVRQQPNNTMNTLKYEKDRAVLLVGQIRKQLS